MIFDIVGLIFDVIGDMFIYVFQIPLGSGVTYGGVIIVTSIVFGIARIVLSQFIEQPADPNKPVASIKKSSKKPMPEYSNAPTSNGSVDRAALIKSIKGD